MITIREFAGGRPAGSRFRLFETLRHLKRIGGARKSYTFRPRSPQGRLRKRRRGAAQALLEILWIPACAANGLLAAAIPKLHVF
jgi:hypothetical protein